MTRKQFIKYVGWIITLPYLLFVLLMVRKNSRVSATKLIRLKVPASDGVWFHEAAIVVKKEGEIRVFSSRCTHLGCRINKLEEGKLICPCHGSMFTEEGRVINGPAPKGLEELTFAVDQETNELIINI